MLTVTVARVDHHDLRRTPAPAPPPGATVYDGDVRLIDDTGATVAIQIVAGADLTRPIARALRRATWTDNMSRSVNRAGGPRLSGISGANMTFGCLPPVPLRKRYGCSRCAVYRTHPELAALLDAATDRVWETFRRYAPAEAVNTRLAVESSRIPRPWQMGSSPWTSGVVNANAGLPYHRDAGNVHGAWSGMLGLRRHCEGGYLHIADLDAWLAIPDGSIALFDGAGTTHGVTPFRFTHPAGYRFTAVWYARAGMSVCAPDPGDEPARAASVATVYAERKAR